MKDGTSPEYNANCVRNHLSRAELALRYFHDTDTKLEDATKDMEDDIHVTKCGAFMQGISDAIEAGELIHVDHGIYRKVRK